MRVSLSIVLLAACGPVPVDPDTTDGSSTSSTSTTVSTSTGTTVAPTTVAPTSGDTTTLETTSAPAPDLGEAPAPDLPQPCLPLFCGECPPESECVAIGQFEVCVRDEVVICEAEVLKCAGLGAICRTDEDCTDPGAPDCVAGACMAACTSHEDCGLTSVCAQGGGCHDPGTGEMVCKFPKAELKPQHQ